MKIIEGLYSGMVMQREENFCNIRFMVSAVGALTVSLGKAEEISVDDEIRYFRLTDIPVGGPYTLELSDQEETIAFENIYVGDVWLLAGQSNMAGVGAYSDIAGEYTPIPQIRYFENDDARWLEAEPRVHRQEHSPEPYMNRFLPYNPNPGYVENAVGPGYFFAEEMYRRTGVPQGLIPCALGGSSLSMWNPDDMGEERNLYHISIHRFQLSGSHIRGIFWYQGCSDCNAQDAEKFTQRMVRLIECYRRDTGNPKLPFVQVQISKFTFTDIGEDANWSRIREMQRTLGEQVPCLDTVATTTAVFQDCIHLHAKYQKQLGIRAAESMFHLCFDPMGTRSLPAPALADIWIDRSFGYAIAVRFKNLHGGLAAQGEPWGFSLSTVPDNIDRRLILRIDLFEDTAYLHCELPAEEVDQVYLSYFFGNGTYSNITDGAGRPIPAFGPLRLADVLREV